MDRNNHEMASRRSPEAKTPYEYFATEEEWGSIWIMPGLGFEEKVLEETDRYIIKKDWNGNIVKEFKNGQGWTPQPIKFLIKNKKDWEKYKSRIQATEDQLPPDIQKIYKKQLFPYHHKLCSYFRENNMPVIYHTDGDVRKGISIIRITLFPLQ